LVLNSRIAYLPWYNSLEFYVLIIVFFVLLKRRMFGKRHFVLGWYSILSITECCALSKLVCGMPEVYTEVMWAALQVCCLSVEILEDHIRFLNLVYYW
jgi:hypothetical protein